MKSANEFPVRIGLTVKLVSLFSTLLLFGMALIFQLQVVPRLPINLTWLPWGLLAIPLLALPFTVRGYRIDGATLYVRRLLHESAIDLSGLRSVEVLPRAFAGSIRSFGNGGMFSFSGWFWRRGMGSFKAYAMDLGPGVLLCTEQGRSLVTPTDPEALAVALKQRIRA